MNQERFRLKVFVFVFLGVLLLGTAGFMVIEGLSFADALYFSIVTVATVGYGDIHPATQIGKALAIFLIIMGVGTFLGVVANATEIMLTRREKQVRARNLNMVVGLFFSELGTELLSCFSDLDPRIEMIRKHLTLAQDSSKDDFDRVKRRVGTHDFEVVIKREKLDVLRSFLQRKMDILLRFLENPNLLEHESFTELLWSIFHLNEELRNRDDFTLLPETDIAHLANDIKRAYTRLVRQWLDYMKHLRYHYPYLFSLAIRTNPFDKETCIVIE
jgi:voltage-gated potassium channel